MNQRDFNELVNLYIRTKAAELVVKSYGSTKTLYTQRMDSIDKMLTRVGDQVEAKNKRITEIDEQINQLNSKTTKVATDEIEILTLKRGIVQCEAMFLSNEITKLTVTKKSSIFRDENTWRWIKAEKLLQDTEKQLLDKFKLALADSRPDLDEKNLTSLANIYTDSDAVTGDKSFVKNLNNEFNTSFPFLLSYKDLTDQLGVILASSYIQSSLTNTSSKNKYTALKKILSSRETKTDEQVYHECQQYAKSAQDTSLLGVICQGLANDDLILLGSVALQEVVTSKEGLPTEYNPSDEFKTHYTDKQSSKYRENQYSSTVDLYLQYRSAYLASQTAIEQIQVLFNLSREFLPRIAETKSDIQDVSTAIQENQSRKETLAKKTPERMERYPTVAEEISKQAQNDIAQADGEIEIFNIINIIKKEQLAERNTEYTARLLTYREQFVQCISLFQLTASLEAQLQELILRFSQTAQIHADKKTSDETLRYPSGIIAPNFRPGCETFTSRLNSLTSESHEYTKTYESFNKLIHTLANHEHWKELKKQGINVSAIERLALILNKSDLNTQNCFNEINKYVATLFKPSRLPWEEKPHAAVLSFLKVVMDKDILKLQTYAMEFDYLPAIDKNKQFKL